MSDLYTPALVALPSPATDGSQLTYAATVVLNMLGEPVQELNLAGDVTFELSGISEQKKIDVIVREPLGAGRNLTFPADWVFVGTKPSNISGSKTGRLTLLTNGITDADVVAQWAVQA